MAKKSFKEVYEDIIVLQKVDAKKNKATILHHLGKTAEEFGELAQEVNKTTGRKTLKKEETPEVINENILQEGVDTIQCIISIFASRGITFAQMKSKMIEKNMKWESQINKVKKF